MHLQPVNTPTATQLRGASATSQSPADAGDESLVLDNVSNRPGFSPPLAGPGIGGEAAVTTTSALGLFERLTPEMREIVGLNLDANGLDRAVQISSAVCREVGDYLSRLGAEAKASLWFEAAEQGLPALINVLLDMGMDGAIMDAQSRTALQVAAKTGNVPVARILLERVGDQMHATSSDGLPGASAFLHWCARWGDELAVATLLSAGANVNTVVGHESVLMAAIENKDFKTFEVIMEASPDLNWKSPWDGSAALSKAVDRGFNRAVESLLKQPGILFKVHDFQGRTPSRIAELNAMYDRGTPRIQDLLKQYAASRAHPESKAWCKAAIAGDLAAMSDLHGRYGDAILRSVQPGSASAIWYAAAHGHLEVVKSLVSWGVEADGHDGDGKTALRAASDGNHLDVADYLISCGADTNVRDGQGDTPLQYAVVRRRLKMAGLLLKGGCDPNIHSYDGQSRPLAWAAQHHMPRMCDLLLQHGAHANLVQPHGVSPAEWVARWGIEDTKAVFQKHLKPVDQATA